MPCAARRNALPATGSILGRVQREPDACTHQPSGTSKFAIRAHPAPRSLRQLRVHARRAVPSGPRAAQTSPHPAHNLGHIPQKVTHSPGGNRQQSNTKPATRRHARNTVGLSPHRRFIHPSLQHTTDNYRPLKPTNDLAALLSWKPKLVLGVLALVSGGLGIPGEVIRHPARGVTNCRRPRIVGASSGFRTCQTPSPPRRFPPLAGQMAVMADKGGKPTRTGPKRIRKLAQAALNADVTVEQVDTILEGLSRPSST